MVKYLANHCSWKTCCVRESPILCFWNPMKVFTDKMTLSKELKASKLVFLCIFVYFCVVCTAFKSFFSIRVFFHEYSQFTGQRGKGETISLLLPTTSTRFTDTVDYRRKLIFAHSYTRTGHPWVPGGSRQPLSCDPKSW